MLKAPALIASLLLCYAAGAESTTGDARLAAVEQLTEDYDQAMKAFYDLPRPESPTPEEQIALYDAIPIWDFAPRFVEIIDAEPADEAALRACQWIIDRTLNVGNNDRPMYAADQRAWQVLASHHVTRPVLIERCAAATYYHGAAQQLFLRGLLERDDLTRAQTGFAKLALAELLTKDYELCERGFGPPADPDAYIQHVIEASDPRWSADLTSENAERALREAIGLFREVLDKYADVPVEFTAPGFRDLENYGEKASKSLYALEHLTRGAVLPNITGEDLDGKPLDLADYRGKVVLISVWFTGCGPCMAMIPQEKKLLEEYHGKPFALLGVCNDSSRETAQQTAKDKEMGWPSWYDGAGRPIARRLNVLGWPSTYLLDQKGRIVAKQLRSEELDQKIAELMTEVD